MWRKAGLLGIIVVLATLLGCEKEPRKVDINDGTENPIERYLVIEVSHRYSYTADSLLPGVGVTLYRNDDDLLIDNYYRTDTTDSNGKLTFSGIKAGEFVVILTHKQLGRREEHVSMTSQVVYDYEYFSF